MTWQDQLRTELAEAKKVAVLGAGSILCGDDAAGMLLIERLQELLPADGSSLLMGGSTAPENFTGQIRTFQPDTLILVDAAFFDAAVGEIALLDRKNIKGIGFSTHMLPLHVMLDYIESEIGCHIIIVGIQPGETEFATEPSQAVKDAVAELAAFLAKALSA